MILHSIVSRMYADISYCISKFPKDAVRRRCIPGQYPGKGKFFPLSKTRTSSGPTCRPFWRQLTPHLLPVYVSRMDHEIYRVRRDCEGGPNAKRNSSWFYFGVAGGSANQIITMVNDARDRV